MRLLAFYHTLRFRSIRHGCLAAQVLLRLRPIADTDGAPAKGKKANTEAAYQLLEALYSLMDPAAYLSGISGLLHHEVRQGLPRILIYGHRGPTQAILRR